MHSINQTWHLIPLAIKQRKQFLPLEHQLWGSFKVFLMRIKLINRTSLECTCYSMVHWLLKWMLVQKQKEMITWGDILIIWIDWSDMQGKRSKQLRHYIEKVWSRFPNASRFTGHRWSENWLFEFSWQKLSITIPLFHGS